MRLSLALLALLLVLPALGLAQDLAGPSDRTAINSAPEAPAPRTFGITATTFVALSPWDFVPQESGDTYQTNANAGNGFTLTISSTTGSGFTAVAPLHLPEGAIVTQMEVVFCDTSATRSFASFFVTQPRTGPAVIVSGPFSTNAEVLVCPTARAGVFGAPIQIDNKNNAYFVRFQTSAFDATIQLASMRVGYVLQVSPAPVTATFNDVPTSHPFFQFIEALAAAGITGGCSTTPPLYCPDAQVTRGQMAAFISRALGLQFAP